jgi:mannitol/fructose-specific phosphotransferase system IIA component (Ntr-type)
MRSILTALQEGRLFELASTKKDDALEFLARVIDANPDIEVGTDAIEEIKKREQEYNTGIGLGVGVPHVRSRREEGDLFCAIGWSQAGVDYGAPDGMPVHLVVMYYIPGAQKRVYLKEVSSLVKAIRGAAGGIEQIAHAQSLTEVRNLLLDWVSGLGESGPDAVARMIKLDVKASLAAPSPALPAQLPAPVPARFTHLVPFSVLVSAGAPLVLANEVDFIGALEKDPGLVVQLTDGRPFVMAGRQVFVTGTTSYAAGRVMYQCVAVSEQPRPAPSAPRS